MKRIIISAIMLAFAVTVSFVSHSITKNSLTQLSQSLESLAESSSAATEKELGEIYKKWNKSSILLHLFINNDAISEIERNMDALRFYAPGEALLFKQGCINAMTAINEIIEIEKVTFKNIF